MAKTVVLDTNFLLLPGRRRVDVIADLQKEGYTVVTLSSVVAELESMALKRSETARHARLALQLIKRKGLKTIQSSATYADEAIVAYCRTNNAAAATQDLALRRRLRSAGVPVVTYNRSGKLGGTNVLQAQSPGSHPRPTRPVR